MTLKEKILLTIIISKLSISGALGQKQDTLKLYAGKEMRNFKGKNLDLNCKELKLQYEDSISSSTKTIELKYQRDLEHATEIDVVIVYTDDTGGEIQYYLVINGEKYLVKLSSYLQYKSHFNKQDHFIFPDSHRSQSMSSSHSSHASHHSHLSSNPQK